MYFVKYTVYEAFSSQLPGRRPTTSTCSAATTISRRDEQEDVVRGLVLVPSIPSKKTNSPLCMIVKLLWRRKQTRQDDSCSPAHEEVTSGDTRPAAHTGATAANQRQTVAKPSEEVGIFTVIFITGVGSARSACLATVTAYFQRDLTVVKVRINCRSHGNAILGIRP